MKLPDAAFEGAEAILDVGGWFKPEPRATHVVDRMPWETRGATLNTTRLPNERFSKETWFQADFLNPGLRLPFEDGQFDLILCGHTIEDLENPEPLLTEMERVGKRGFIQSPSRLAEQTIGIRDRESTRPGHPHHHWIAESVGGRLLLYSKEDSDLKKALRLLPLSFTERTVRDSSETLDMTHGWESQLAYRLIRGPECAHAATAFVARRRIGRSVRFLDRVQRFARRIRSRLSGQPTDDTSWWPRIVADSRPYSRIELK